MGSYRITERAGEHGDEVEIAAWGYTRKKFDLLCLRLLDEAETFTKISEDRSMCGTGSDDWCRVYRKVDEAAERPSAVTVKVAEPRELHFDYSETNSVSPGFWVSNTPGPHSPVYYDSTEKRLVATVGGEEIDLDAVPWERCKKVRARLDGVDTLIRGHDRDIDAARELAGKADNLALFVSGEVEELTKGAAEHERRLTALENANGWQAALLMRHDRDMGAMGLGPSDHEDRLDRLERWRSFERARVSVLPWVIACLLFLLAAAGWLSVLLR